LNEKPSSQSDDDLQRIIAEDSQAVQRFVDRWHRLVFAHCRAKLNVRADAEDATQETFIRAIAQLEGLRSESALGGWLRGIAHNVCVDTIRRHARRRETPIHEADVAAKATSDCEANAMEDREEQERLLRAIHTLPEELREVLLLHYYEDMTYDQLAAWLGVARSTASERLSKARKMLRTLLCEDHRETHVL